MKVRALLLIILSALIIACGNDGRSVQGRQASAAYRWDVTVASAEAACFAPGAPLELQVTVLTRSGVPIADPDYVVTTSPPGALESDESGGWIFRGEGSVTITVSYRGAVATGGTISPIQFELYRDNTAPSIAVVQPARAAMLFGSGGVRVQGEISDAGSTLQSVKVNGTEVLATDGASAYIVDSELQTEWGLNVFEVEALDTCGHSAKHSQSFLLSQEYRPIATAADVASRVPAGQVLRLTQEAVDDGNRDSLNDAATLIERYFNRNLSAFLEEATLGAVVASDVAACGGDDFFNYTVTIREPGLSVNAPRISEISLASGGSRQLLSADSVAVPVTIDAEIFSPQCGSTDVSADRTLSAFVLSSDSSTSSTVGTDGRVGVDIQSLSLNLGLLTFTSPAPTFFSPIQISVLLNLAQRAVESIISNKVRELLPPILASFFNQPLTGQLTIDSGPFEATLNAQTGIDGILVNPMAMTQSAFAQVYPSSGGTPHQQLGPITRQTVPADLTTHPGPVTYAVDDNLLNEGFWSLWHGGSLEIPDLIGFPGAAMSISARLPPVVMPGSQAGQAEIGVGDIEVTLILDLAVDAALPFTGTLRVDAYASLLNEVGITYDAIAEQLRPEFNPDRKSFFLQLRSAADETGPITDPSTLTEIELYASEFIQGYAEELLLEALVSAILPKTQIAFEEPLGGTIESLAFDFKSVVRSSDHVIMDMSFVAGVLPDPDLDAFLTLNNPWLDLSLDDANIPEAYRDQIDYSKTTTDSRYDSATTDVDGYRARRSECSAAGTGGIFDLRERCRTQWKWPLAYGYYCGGGRPLESIGPGTGFESTPLDPVDFCCRLHDRNLFDPDTGLNALSPINACGFVMCLRQGTGYPDNITSQLRDVENARQSMFRMARKLCRVSPGGDFFEQLTPLPDIAIVEPL